jgi:hypothetical protein
MDLIHPLHLLLKHVSLWLEILDSFSIALETFGGNQALWSQ